MTKTLKSLLLTLTLSLGSSCKENHQPPSLKICATAKSQGFLCNDQKLEEGKQDFFEPYQSGYICTDERNFNALYGYCAELRKSLIKCDRKK